MMVPATQIDSQGRCLSHPFVQLQRLSPRTGEWKALLDNCPLCAMDNKSMCESVASSICSSAVGGSDNPYVQSNIPPSITASTSMGEALDALNGSQSSKPSRSSRSSSRGRNSRRSDRGSSATGADRGGDRDGSQQQRRRSSSRVRFSPNTSDQDEEELQGNNNPYVRSSSSMPPPIAMGELDDLPAGALSSSILGGGSSVSSTTGVLRTLPKYKVCKQKMAKQLDDSNKVTTMSMDLSMDFSMSEAEMKELEELEKKHVEGGPAYRRMPSIGDERGEEESEGEEESIVMEAEENKEQPTPVSPASPTSEKERQIQSTEDDTKEKQMEFVRSKQSTSNGSSRSTPSSRKHRSSGRRYSQEDVPTKRDPAMELSPTMPRKSASFHMGTENRPAPSSVGKTESNSNSSSSRGRRSSQGSDEKPEKQRSSSVQIVVRPDPEEFPCGASQSSGSRSSGGQGGGRSSSQQPSQGGRSLSQQPQPGPPQRRLPRRSNQGDSSQRHSFNSHSQSSYSQSPNSQMHTQFPPPPPPLPFQKNNTMNLQASSSPGRQVSQNPIPQPPSANGSTQGQNLHTNMIVNPSTNYDDEVSTLSFMGNSISSGGNQSQPNPGNNFKYRSGDRRTSCEDVDEDEDDEETSQPAGNNAGDTSGMPSFNTNEYDSRGRCLHHPHIKLRKKKLFNRGWKVLMSACPDCCVDELRRIRLVEENKRHMKEKRDGKSERSSGGSRLDRSDKSGDDRSLASNGDARSLGDKSEKSHGSRSSRKSHGSRKKKSSRHRESKSGEDRQGSGRESATDRSDRHGSGSSGGGRREGLGDGRRDSMRDSSRNSVRSYQSIQSAHATPVLGSDGAVSMVGMAGPPPPPPPPPRRSPSVDSTNLRHRYAQQQQLSAPPRRSPSQDAFRPPVRSDSFHSAPATSAGINATLKPSAMIGSGSRHPRQRRPSDETASLTEVSSGSSNEHIDDSLRSSTGSSKITDSLRSSGGSSKLLRSSIGSGSQGPSSSNLHSSIVPRRASHDRPNNSQMVPVPNSSKAEDSHKSKSRSGSSRKSKSSDPRSGSSSSSQDPSPSSNMQRGTIHVRQMQYTDPKTSAPGVYTGQVNTSFVPHGRGIMEYDDRSLGGKDGEWKNGRFRRNQGNSSGGGNNPAAGASGSRTSRSESRNGQGEQSRHRSRSRQRSSSRPRAQSRQPVAI